MGRSCRANHAMVLQIARPKDAIEDATVVRPRHAAWLVRQHRFNGRPLVVGQFITHDSSPQFGDLNHGSRAGLNGSSEVVRRVSAFGGEVDVSLSYREFPLMLSKKPVRSGGPLYQPIRKRMLIFSIMAAFAGSTSHRHRKTLPQIVRISSRQTAEGQRGLSQLLSLWLSIRQQRIWFAHVLRQSLTGGV